MNNFKFRDKMRYFFNCFTLLIMLIGQSEAIIGGSLSTTTTEINQLSTLSFNFQLTTDVASGGYFLLTFSSGVDLSSSTSLSCTSIFGLKASSTPTCTKQSSTVLQISNVFANTDKYIIIEVGNFLLPSYVSTFTVSVATYTSASVVVESSSDSTFKFDTTEGTLSLSLTSQSSVVVGEYTNMKLDFTVENKLSSSGYILISLPKWNPGTQTKTKVSSYIKYATSDYSTTYSGYLIDCSATSHSNIKCIFTSTTPATVSAISTTYDYLKITGLSSDISAGSTLSVTLSNSRFRNPSSTKPITTISASTYDLSGNQIDGTSSVSYSASTSATLSATSFSVTASDSELNQQATYSIKITTALPLPIGTVMYLTIPTQISIYDSDGTNYLLNSAIGYSPLYSVIQLSITDSTTQKIQLSNLIPLSSNYVDEGTSVQFTLYSLQNPSSTVTTDTFQLQIYDQDYIIMSLDTTTGYKFTATAGSLTSFSITPDNYRTRAEVSYAFSFIIENSLKSGSWIHVVVPTEVTVDSSSLVLTATQTVSSTSVSLIYTTSNRTISIKNCFSSAITAPVIVKFSISSGLSNPNTTLTTSAFTVATIDTSGSVVDSNSSITITATANELTGVTITACTGSTSMTSTVCVYQIKIYTGSTQPILEGSYLQIDLPDEISLYDSTNTMAYSYTEGVEDSKKTVTIVNSRTIQFKNIFTSTDTSYYTMDMFSVYLTNLTTPRSTAPTQTFKVRIYDENGYLQYKKESQIYSTLTQAQFFSKALIKRSSEVNGVQDTVYEFTLNTSLNVYKNEYIKVTAPSGVTFLSSKNQCQGVTGLKTNLSCSVDGQSLFVTITPSDSSVTNISAGTVLKFKVSNIQNPLSLEPTDTFQIYVTSSRIYDYYINQMTYGLSISNSYPNNLTSVYIYPDSNKLATTTNYAFYFTTTSQMPINSYIEVEFPSALYSPFTASKLACSSIKNIASTIACYPLSTNKYVVQIFNGYNSSTLSGGNVIAFKINGIKNPSVSSNGTFTIRTLTINGYQIDSTYDFKYSIGCTSPCATCIGDQSTCSSCQQTSATSFLYLYGSTCGKSCPTGYYDDTQQICQKCTYPCQNCMLNSTQCTSCLSSSGMSFISYSDHKCYSSCPSGTYSSQSSLSCESCTSPCSECSDSPDKCTSCAYNYYYWENKCYGQCPNTSVPISSNEVKECQSCKKPCQTCSISRDNCTSCQLSPTLYYLHNHQCVEECPSPYLPNSKNECEKMDEPIYPFLTFILSGFIIIFCFVSNKIFPRTRMFTAYLSLQSIIMLIIWVYLIVFLARDNHKSSTAIVALAFIFNQILNIFWYAYYRKKIVKLDQGYQIYMRHYPKTQRTLVALSFITTFQLFRLQYSRLFNTNSLSCVLDLKEKYYQKLNRYSLIQLTFVYLPIIASNIYNLNWTWYGRQVFWIDIECIITTILILIAHIVVIIMSDRSYSTNKFDQSKSLTMMTQGLPQETKPGENVDEITVENAQRRMILNRIVDKIKSNKDALETLGMPTGEDGNGGDTDADKMDFTNPDEMTGRNLNHLVYNNNQQTVFKNKQYQSVGVLRKTPNTRDETTAIKKKHKKKVIDQDSSENNEDSDGNYHQLHQESSREDLTTTQINELDFTSAPINADDIIKKDSSALQKLENFQKEIENIPKQKRLNNEKLPNESPLKQKNLSALYHTLGMTQQQYEETKDQQQNRPYVSSSGMNTNDINQMTNNIIKNVIFNQSPQGTNTLGHDSEVFQSNLNRYSASGAKKGQSDKDFDAILEDENDGVEISEYELKKIKKDLDHKMFENLRKDIHLQKQSEVQQELEMNEILVQLSRCENQIKDESKKKEELYVVVDDLKSQIRELLEEFEAAQKKRDEELQFLEDANFTSDEEDMGITPSSYNVLNQRFSDQNDLKIYLNMIGQPSLEFKEQNEPSVAQGVDESNGVFGAQSDINRDLRLGSSRQNQRRNSKVVPFDDKEGSLNSFTHQNSQPLNTGANDEGDQENKMDNESLNSMASTVTMTKEEFMKLLEEESRQVVLKLQSLTSDGVATTKEDQEFAEVAKLFLKQMQETGNTDMRLIDYIKELDKRGRKKIEEKYMKIFQDGIKKKQKLRKKRKNHQKDIDPNKYHPYFNFLPFERAVIESKGKTPFNNKEVEKIIQNPSAAGLSKRLSLREATPSLRQQPSLNKTQSLRQ